MTERSTWQRLRGAVVEAVIRLPEPLALRLLPQQVRYDPAAVPAPSVPPVGLVRLYVAPVNYAAQGFAWARAAETLPGVGAVNMQYRGTKDFGFPADVAVEQNAFTMSHRWGARQLAAVAGGFSHVLFEAEKPVFGRACGFDVVAEVAALRGAGVRVGMISHGSDLRLPSRHRGVDRWSPFDADDEWVASLEALALRNRELLGRVDAPVFVATPDLLLDWPAGVWLPIVVDPRRWVVSEPALAGEGPVRVVHAPTNRRIKGTDLIAGTIQALDAEGVIGYRQIEGVAADRMPAVYAGADVVIEQFRIGNYATVAIEAMAAGRLVVAHVHDQVRAVVLAETGWELPVVEATPDTLEAVLRDVSVRREHYRGVAVRGAEFAREVHDGRFSGRVLADFLGVTGQPMTKDAP